MRKYLVRLDDACPYMDKKKWNRVFSVLERQGISPLIGIIPSNNDLSTMIDDYDNQFWEKMREYQQKGWSFALHGYDHCCISDFGGINPVHNRSEFAGIERDIQTEKIIKGYNILINNGIYPKFFFAPSHTFDLTTVEVIKNNTKIRFISDTIALSPYEVEGMVFVPQQMGKFRKVRLNGYWTFCFHPNEMADEAIDTFEQFIIDNSSCFISFESLLQQKWGKKSLTDKCLQKLYFMLRKIK